MCSFDKDRNVLVPCAAQRRRDSPIGRAVYWAGARLQALGQRLTDWLGL